MDNSSAGSSEEDIEVDTSSTGSSEEDNDVDTSSTGSFQEDKKVDTDPIFHADKKLLQLPGSCVVVL